MLRKVIRTSIVDPNKDPYETFIPVMDSIYRYILFLILQRVQPSLSDSTTYPKPIIINKELKESITECLLYLRDRVGVPRDLSVHGAKQFRSYINHFIEEYL